MIIRLVPNTGIQYVTLADLDTEELARAGCALEALSPSDDPAAFLELREVVRRPASSDFYADTEQDAGGYTRRSADANAVLDLAAARNGIWIPLPFDRGGPWVCLFLRQGQEGRFRMAIAVDTTFEEYGNAQGVSSAEDGDRELLPCARRFWRNESVRSFLAALIADSVGLPNFRTPTPAALQLAIVALATYLRGQPGGRDGLKISLAPLPERASVIKVDLVLDLGNSRTCALLMEEQPTFRQERLELVYPRDPFETYLCPFETQFAFVDHEVVPSGGNLQDEGRGFRFLSQIVMGPAAGKLLRQMSFDPQSVGMTSPKRYLWETVEPVRWEWRLADRIDPQTRRPPVIRGDVLRHMNPARPLARPAGPDLPVNPNYPRHACAVWCIIEMLEQAFRQINSPAWRRPGVQAAMCDRRREIANLVIMYPAGMHSEEIRNYHAACETACRHWAQFRTDPDTFAGGREVSRDDRHGIAPPVVQMICDEALAIQICWLYGEAVHRHRSRLDALMAHLGRKRGPEGAETNTLRIASLDIGGGTIDLAIADYTKDDAQQQAAAVKCKRLFHDGISRAGDEIVRGVLEQEVFRAIVDQCKVDVGRWNADFLKADGEQASALRRLLVRNVWTPIAMACLEGVEQAEQFEARLGDIPGVDPLKLRELERILFPGDAATRIGDVVIRLDRKRMKEIIGRSVGRTITQCCDIVDQYQCDLLIVGGRPSSNPAVRQQILLSMAVPPGQVVFLSESRVGDWYPFSNGHQRIGDAKTCGVVGAAIAFRGMYQWTNFRLKVEQTEEPEAIIGWLLADTRALTSSAAVEFGRDMVLENLERGHSLSITPSIGADEGLVIALRRIDHPNAEAKPIYLVRLKSRYKRMLQSNPVHQENVTIELEYGPMQAQRMVAIGDRILLPAGTIRDVVRLKSARGDVRLPNGSESAETAIECVLKTMIEGEGYWIDTGRFRELKPEDRP